ncbi:hypothetical protein ACQEVC_15065 [Plantactinospora sp. CA-294935]|uniref:hypothetical protein n=1 Tax=Plantactinospora sp. CA-294935 TaxID=3240012 RepID=UPI003D8AFD9F
MSAGTERDPETGPERDPETGPARFPEAGSEAGRPEPPPLPRRDVVRLWLAAEPDGGPEWLVRNRKAVALATGLALWAVFVVVIPVAPCTAAAPCGPDRVGNMIVGLVGSAPLLALVRLEFAAVATGTTLVTTLGYELTQAEHLPPWFYLLLVAYAVGCGLLARRGGSPARYRSGLRQWRERAERAVPARPSRLPRPRLGPAVAAMVLLVAALALAGGSSLRQSQVDAQQRSGEVVTATVRSHPTWGVVELVFLDGRPVEVVSVADSADYPVGSTVRIALDDAGLRQLVSEPYDLTPWLALAVLLGATGLGLSWRVAGSALAGRRFFRRPQPVSTVRVHQAVDRVYVYAGTGPDVLPVAEIEVREDLTPTIGREPGRAVLHGVPVPGQWCTVTVDGRTLSPTRPVLPPEPTAPWVTNRRRGALPLLRRGPVPSYLPGRHPAVDRDAWPRLNWVGNSLFVALLLGAVVAGTALSEPLLRRLAYAACTVEECSTAALALTGWTLVGLPLLLIGVTYAVLPRGSHSALGITAVALVALATGLSIAYPAGGYAALRMSHPELLLLYPGVLAGLGALLLGRAVGRVGTTGARGRPDAARPTGWFDRVRAGGRLPLVATAVLQLPALLVGLLGALIIP